MNKPFCSPPADKSAPAAVVVTPAGSMAGGCALSALRYLAFVGPMPEHFTGSEVPGCVMTGSLSDPDFHSRVLRDDAVSFESLDAPDVLASGGCRYMSFGAFSITAHVVGRPG